MEFLKLLLYAYFTVGIINLFLTAIIFFRPREKHVHLSRIKDKWHVIWTTNIVGKPLAILTIIISIIWLVIAWPFGIIKSFQRLKNGKDEI